MLSGVISSALVGDGRASVKRARAPLDLIGFIFARCLFLLALRRVSGAVWKLREFWGIIAVMNFITHHKIGTAAKYDNCPVPVARSPARNEL